MKYKIEDILIGDEVYFESTNIQTNYDEYWNVTGKSGNHIMIELKKFGLDKTWALDIAEVVYLMPVSKLRKERIGSI